MRRQFCQPQVNFCSDIILITAVEAKMHFFYSLLKLAQMGIGGKTKRGGTLQYCHICIFSWKTLVVCPSRNLLVQKSCKCLSFKTDRSSSLPLGQDGAPFVNVLGTSIIT